MLNPFPIMWLSIFAYFLLRVIVAYTLLRLGFTHFKHRSDLGAAFQSAQFSGAQLRVWMLIILEVGVGLCILFGYQTQYACLILAALSITMLSRSPRINSPLIPSRYYYLLLFGCSLSLFITGAGVFAVDLPL